MADTQGNPTEFDRALRGTLIGLWAERMARAFWPCVTLGLLFGAALAFGVQDVMPAAWSSALGLGGLAAILVSMIWGAWRLDVPHRADAARIGLRIGWSRGAEHPDRTCDHCQRHDHIGKVKG
jgi:hypothetical protein